jgi:uncharacterized protein YqjF (DUF2071 family)
MDWRDALFLHWRVDVEATRRIIPPELDLDLYDAEAWISIVAFRITGARLRGIPRFAALPPFDEINVRTYVRDAAKHGVWFLSLDATNPLAVQAGRTGLHLPYVNARIEGAHNGATCTYRSNRSARTRNIHFEADAHDARLDVSARVEPEARTAAPRTLEHWLAERYCFFTVDNRGRTLRGDVEHEPWPLHDATPTILENTLLAAANIEPLDNAPLTHASPGVTTRAWPLHSASIDRSPSR